MQRALCVLSSSDFSSGGICRGFKEGAHVMNERQRPDLTGSS